MRTSRGGQCTRSFFFLIFDSLIGAPRAYRRSPGVIRRTKPLLARRPGIGVAWRLFLGRGGAQNRAWPPFEATRLGPGQRPCRRPKPRFRPPVHTPAAWLGPIRPIAPRRRRWRRGGARADAIGSRLRSGVRVCLRRRGRRAFQRVVRPPCSVLLAWPLLGGCAVVLGGCF